MCLNLLMKFFKVISFSSPIGIQIGAFEYLYLVQKTIYFKGYSMVQ